MRTVSFSNESVIAELTKLFHCVAINTEGDPSAGISIRHRPSDAPGPCVRGVGRQNVQCLFLTPKQQVVHVASGYLDADDLLKEIKFARDLLKKISSVKNTAKAKRLVSQAHHNRRTSSAESQPGLSPETLARFMNGSFEDSTSSDARFIAEHPLIPVQQLLRAPELLVGNHRTAFFSTSIGSQANDSIRLQNKRTPQFRQWSFGR